MEKTAVLPKVIVAMLGFRTDLIKEEAERFSSALNKWREFALQAGHYFPFVTDDVPPPPSEDLFRTAISEVINDSGDSAVIFVISSFESARTEKGEKLFQEIRTIAGEKVKTYYIILDMLKEFERFGHGFHGDKMGSEHEAFWMGALPCFYNYDQMSFSMGYKRVIELMNRIIGADLLKPHFPDYDREMLSQIALHINRENFNSVRPRIGAIPKYGLDPDGRPFIAEWMIKLFDSNIAEWEAKKRKVISTVVYLCPHGDHPLDHYDVWDRGAGLVMCYFCKELVDVSGTPLLKNS